MTANTSSLRYLTPNWFVVVMGLSGLTLAWHNATPWLGALASSMTQLLTSLTVLIGLVLTGFSFLRWLRFPQEVREDLAHPVRHAFVATMPVSLVLLVTLATTLLGSRPVLQALWMVGAIWQVGVTVSVMSRWWMQTPTKLSGSNQFWTSLTPVLLIPVAGNVVTPLAGVALEMHAWSAAQFGLGLLMWPVVLVLLAVRVGMVGPWPIRLQPSVFITVAPPAVIGLGFLQLGAPDTLAWAAWGIALVFLGLCMKNTRPWRGQPFHMAFWALSFPLAAFSTLSLRLAPSASQPFQAFALGFLLIVSLLIATLFGFTLRGLYQGQLLQAELTKPSAHADPMNGEQS